MRVLFREGNLDRVLCGVSYGAEAESQLVGGDRAGDGKGRLSK